MRTHPTRRLRTGLLPLLVLLVASVAPATAQDGGGSFLIQADAAWVDAETRIAPAFVVIQDGVVTSVSSRAPRSTRGLEKVEVSGTLAAGVVDAWTTLGPGALAGGRSGQSARDAGDAVPADVAGADPRLAAEVAAARQSGLAAVYLGERGGSVIRGVGRPASFSAHDVFVTSDVRFLDFATGSARGAGIGGLGDVEGIASVFRGAAEYREKMEEYADKLEEYEKDLAKYREKLEEGGGEDAEGEDEGGAEEEPQRETPPRGRGAGRGGRGGGGGPPGARRGGGGNGGNGGEAKGKSGPRRPQRPKKPSTNAGQQLALEAIDGAVGVRIEANSAADIRRVLAIQAEHGFDLVIAGGAEADLVADALAEARVPVVLALVDDPADGDERSLAARFERLLETDVSVALASGPGAGSWELVLSRAGTLVAAGADAEAVWAALTSAPATILGLDGSHGRLATGARGDLLLFGGSSPFDASAPLRAHHATHGFAD